MVRNRIPSVCLYFCSTERNSELFSLPRNGSDRNSERNLILFHGKEFRAFFSSAEVSERNSENFLFRGKAGIPPEQTNCSVFRGKIFLSLCICKRLRNPGIGCAGIFGSKGLIFALKQLKQVLFACFASKRIGTCETNKNRSEYSFFSDILFISLQSEYSQLKASLISALL
jgi:hypothetical protein